MGKRSPESKRENFFSTERRTPKITPNIAHDESKPVEDADKKKKVGIPVKTNTETSEEIQVQKSGAVSTPEKKEDVASKGATKDKASEEKSSTKTKESLSRPGVVNNFDLTDLQPKRIGGKNISIYFEEDLLNFLDTFTVQTGISKSTLIRRLLRNYMESCEE